MSFAFIAMTMLLGSSVVVAVFLQPSKEQPAASSHNRCNGESLESIRKSLLNNLDLQYEPRLPAGGLDSIRVQWQTTYSTISQRDAPEPAAAGVSGNYDSGNTPNPKCCSMATEIFMKDLGWDSWVIHPDRLTIVQCAPCNPHADAEQCPSSQVDVSDPSSQVQVPCCQPTDQKTVPIIYMDEFNSLVISSVQLTRSCGCGPGNTTQSGEE